MSTKPTVFISYSHYDADLRDFTRRLALALEHYTDVYWDRRIEAGEFPTKLQHEIQTREFFVAIMSSAAQRKNCWCRKELAIAKRCKKTIIPVRFFSDEYHDNKPLVSHLSVADFGRDFDTGFRQVTQYILREPYSSWEYLIRLGDKALLECLAQGFIPGLIAREIADWVIVERIWTYLDSRLHELYEYTVAVAAPRTPNGIVRLNTTLLQQLADRNDNSSVHYLQKLMEIVKPYVAAVKALDDKEHKKLGKIATDVITSSKDYLSLALGAKFKGDEFAEKINFYEFDVAEKLREFIIIHSRRSRYLY